MPEQVDWFKARRFRSLASDLGVSAAYLAHRYSLSMGGVSTVILGVKNRAELDECVAAARAGPLSEEEVAAVDATMALARL